MEQNLTWHQIPYQSQDSTLPSKRWGHKTVYIQDEIVLFGGFSDVTYLNDLWTYNIHTNKWQQIKTTGTKPQGKSNFTMHYDPTTNQLMIFGGGGPNKRRFNKISLLKWSTKHWTQVVYDSNNDDDSQVPWQRTYHSSQFSYPYLIMFGGEGAGNVDLDDLWVFNIETRKWAELNTSMSKTTLTSSNNTSNDNKALNNKIQSRKFHSTALINNQFFVISGCKMNYTCIPNIYSIDLSTLFSQENNHHNTDNSITKTTQQKENPNNNNRLSSMIFQWKLHKIDDNQIGLIEKWGHSSQTYNGKIYIFGGRNQQDFNDLIQLNPITNKIKKLNPNTSPQQKLPKSRRRHSSCMIGSSMVIFGGFNQDYFSDLQYISLFLCKDTLNKQKYLYFSNQQSLITLQHGMFYHFMQQMNKDKPQYDIQIYVQSPNKKQPTIIKSISSTLTKHSTYFSHCLLYNQSSNPQRNNINLSLDSLNISTLSFQLFNNFLVKQLLILPKGYKLKQLCELLICADYFQVSELYKLVQNVLTIKVIDDDNSNKDTLNDIFNIAASWNMPTLLKVCAQKKVLTQAYFNTYSRTIGLTFAAARLKDKYVQQVLTEIQFDQIQKGQKKRTKSKQSHFGKNIKEYNLVAEEKKLSKITTSGRRKKSFVEKFVESVSKLCTINVTGEGDQILEKKDINASLMDYQESDDQQQKNSRNQIKIFNIQGQNLQNHRAENC